MTKQKFTFFIVLIIIGLIAFIAFFGLKIGGSELPGANKMRYGIDIRGGIEALYSPVDYNPNDAELESARKIMETRLDNNNITDREITIDKKNKTILIRFPWKSDETEFNAQEAISELGETASLTFKDPDGSTLVEGRDVKTARAVQNKDSNGISSGYAVELTFNSEGTEKFAEATRALIGQNLTIYMDEIIISNPVVQQEIAGGNAIISGLETMEEASDLAAKINAGALPFSMTSSNNSTISPTLGQNALKVMVQAAITAFIVVCLFMLFYYRLPGCVACIALTLQVSGQLLALSLPQFTLTLPGIAAIVLSIGMGVDANVIISERIKEEINNGRSLKGAIKQGFHRAFSSVFDGNITVIIVAVILMIFGSGSILSFGYSLLTGVILNFAAGVLATRLMIKSLSSYKALQNPVFYGAKSTRQKEELA